MIFREFLAIAFSNLYFLGFLAMTIAYVLSVRISPVIVYTVLNKNSENGLENSIKSIIKTPSLSGLGLVVIFSFSLILFGIFLGLEQGDLLKLGSFLAAMIILVLLEIKNDVITLSPKKKLIGQISAASIVFLSGIRFQGFLGIEELPYILSVLGTISVLILTIKLLCRMDGIANLAGVTALIANTSFLIFFLLNKEFLMTLISSMLIGVTIGLFTYNKTKGRIFFLGNIGAKVLGFFMAYQAIELFRVNQSDMALFTLPNASIVVLVLLSFPICIALGIIYINLRPKQNPLSVDGNSKYQYFLESIRLNSRQFTLGFFIVQVLSIILAFFIGNVYINVQLYIFICVVPAILLSVLSMRKVKHGVNHANINLRLKMEHETKEESKEFLENLVDSPLVSQKDAIRDQGKRSTRLKEKATLITKERYLLRRRNIAKNYAEEFRKISSQH